MSAGAAATATSAVVSAGFLDGYITIFGMRLAKTTILLFVGLIVLLGAFFLYKSWYAKKEIVTKKRNQEVSFNQQKMMQKNSQKDDQDDQDEQDEQDEQIDMTR